jgi:hypothetical protein
MSTKQLKVGTILTIVLSLLALGSSCSKAPTNETAATNDTGAAGKPFKPGDGSITGAIALTAPLRRRRKLIPQQILFVGKLIQTFRLKRRLSKTANSRTCLFT